eukprot:gnl/TRDRNA2_/TRDRNA2_135203_c0_seq1.p1 gnl/TRDRNA2_/TRDRNA2_135203_c0~~gnl/TRDRNA2_/TRDRNA2_135203_c0_seq1.p1  ORF type:complete len:436 (-),score=79.39 gnl/TRDRNA2_/TRDRNA2_135203_c0_seq1:65-1372(-)
MATRGDVDRLVEAPVPPLKRLPFPGSGSPREQDSLGLANRLRTACREGEMAQVKHLIGAIEDVGGEKPHTREVHHKVSKLLSAQDEVGWSPLHYACKGTTTDHNQIVQMLVQAGGDVNLQDENGWSPLHVAAQFADPETISYLVDNLGDRELTDNRCMTPRDCANGNSRRALLESPKEKLEELLIRVRVELRKRIEFKIVNELELLAAEDLCKEFQATIRQSRKDLDRLKHQVEFMLDQPVPVGGLVGDQLAACNRLISVNQTLFGEQGELKEASALIPLLRKYIADVSLMSVMAEVREKFDKLDKQKPDVNPKMRNSIYKDTLETLNVALERGRAGDLLDEAEMAGILASLDAVDGHYASDDLFRLAKELFDILEEACHADCSKKSQEPLEAAIRDIAKKAYRIRLKQIQIPDGKEDKEFCLGPRNCAVDCCVQ